MAPILTRLSNAFGFGASTASGPTPNPSTGAYATGGTVTYNTNDGTRVHTFNSTGSFICKNSNLTAVNYVIVAGGAAGAGGGAGGGGAGGMRGTVPQFPSPGQRLSPFTFSGSTESPQSITITIGAGGAACPPTGGQGGDGEPSSFNTGPTQVEVTGGGTGGLPQTGNPLAAGKSGGSGGGGSADGAGGPGVFAGGGGISNQGNPGGGGYHVGSIYIYGGGGGGCSQAGEAAPSAGSPAVDNRSGSGGNGRELDITGHGSGPGPNAPVWLAGGGAGGTQPGPQDVTAGNGGNGGGGAGLPGTTSPITSNGGQGNPTSGEPRNKDHTSGGDAGDNTGGGGGGSSSVSGRMVSGAGGSGICIISYPAPDNPSVY